MLKAIIPLIILVPALTLADSKLKTSKGPAKPVIKVPDVKMGEFAIFDGKKYQVFSVIEVDKLTLSSDCKVKSGKPTCLAFLAATATLTPPESKYNGSPASTLCVDLKGSNLIAFDSEKKELNFCQFKDGSLANSWSLFYKRNPKSYIK